MKEDFHLAPERLEPQLFLIQATRSRKARVYIREEQEVKEIVNSSEML